MSLTKKIAHNTLAQIAGKIVSTILGLLALALITRYLGQTGFGEYTTIITFLTFFAVMADCGLTLVTAQMISGAAAADESKLLNNLFGLRLVSIIIMLALAPLVLIFFPYSPAIKFGVLIAGVSFIFPALNQVIIGLFQKRLSMDRSALAEVIGRAALLIGVLATRKFSSGLNGILIATVVSGAVSFIAHYFLAIKFAYLKLEFDWQVWKKIYHRAWPLAITIVLNLIYLRADILILSLFRGTEEVGLYGAAYKIIDVLTTVPFMFAGLILPIITAAWLEHNGAYFNKVLQKAFDAMAALAIPLVIGAQFLSKPIMRLVAGRDFIAAGPILQTLIFAVAVIFLGTIFSHAVIALDKQKKMIGFYIFTSLSSLAAYFLFIPRFSYFGAAGVTIYSEVLIAIFSFYCVYKYSSFRLRPKILLISLVSSGLMGYFLYVLPAYCKNGLGGISLSIMAASAIYLLSFGLLGGIDKADLKILLTRRGKDGGQTYGPTNNF